MKHAFAVRTLAGQRITVRSQMKGMTPDETAAA